MWQRCMKGRRWLGGDGRVKTRREYICTAQGEKEKEEVYIEWPLRRMERDFGRA